MALSDAWLKANSGKKREKRFEKADRDGLSVRVTPQGKSLYNSAITATAKQPTLISAPIH